MKLNNELKFAKFEEYMMAEVWENILSEKPHFESVEHKIYDYKDLIKGRVSTIWLL